MVRVALPPPLRPPDPVFHLLPAGSALIRLFDPTRFGATALSFRQFGPLLRFDHHRLTGTGPGIDTDRGIYYSAFTLSGCIVEIFGDTGLIDCGEWRVARPTLRRPVRLLDIRGTGAMRAGSVAALAKVPDHAQAQAWSRYFYETPDYRLVEGILYYNAHNDEDAVALYERAEDALECPPTQIIRLDDPALRPTLLTIAQENHLICLP